MFSFFWLGSKLIPAMNQGELIAKRELEYLLGDHLDPSTSIFRSLRPNQPRTSAACGAGPRFAFADESRSKSKDQDLPRRKLRLPTQISIEAHFSSERNPLRLLGNDLAILHDVDGRAVHAGRLASVLGRKPQSSSNTGCQAAGLDPTRLGFHGPFSIS
ncbi:MAG: hypothetical protein U1F35_06045 [Steroidobacteraceae bacterium]